MSRLLASDARLIDRVDTFHVVFEGLLDVDSGIPEASIRMRRFEDRSVMLVAESYDDGVAAIALTDEQAKALGAWLST